jgi:hypothetical protein
MHRFPQQSVSVGGLDIGSMDFDPARHMPHQIDVLSPMQDVYDSPQVRVQLPHNPMLVTLVGDYRFKGDSPEIARMKSGAVDAVVQGLVDVLPNLDIQDTYRLEDEVNLQKDEEELLDLCNAGLCFVIGDFRKLRLDAPFSQRADVIALKVNHPAERAIMPNVGNISVGGMLEINTNKPRQVRAANALLEQRHMERMSKLQAAGALAGAVILAPKAADLIDTGATDAVIASLVRQIQ